jgi:sterol desaturase/sphingolipid hydroxylase (fatty acid hydroxylase superfamily)
MEAPFSFLPESLWVRGLCASSLAVALTVVLEATCWNDVKRLYLSNKALYYSSLRCNILNNVGLGSATYYFAICFYCQRPGTLSFIEQAQAMVGIVVTEAILYYFIHMAFHEVKGLYWMHSYHHKFNTIVLPSSANAVSIAEYTLAYMTPLVFAVWLTRADEVAAFLGSAVVGVTNLLIHTPWLERYPYHWIFVSASDHLTHHRKVRGNYGAPVLHMDRIVEYCSTWSKAKPS